MNRIVRLSSLTLKNIKNVENGTIFMPMTSKKGKIGNGGDILGIYGQNGSGKTAIVDALYYLQGIMLGETLAPELSEYIDVDKKSAEIAVEFLLIDDDQNIEVGYHVLLRTADNGVMIEREYLNCSFDDGEKRTNKSIFMDFCRSGSNQIFSPSNRLDELVGKKRENITDLIVARKMAEKSNCSYIFGSSSREVFENCVDKRFVKYASIVDSLFWYAFKDLFVIRNTHAGMISARFLLPMTFRIDSGNSGVKGDFVIPLREPIIVDAEKKGMLYALVDQINSVLYTIIPDLKISIKDNGKQTLDSGVDGWKLELMSERSGRKPIPIRMESEGIIKLISILNVLIQAFGNKSICLVVDELDAGVFEYMLGELLDIFAKGAKGQLIFTSHNLRALEMLDKKSIMFSTTNPKNRYIHMKNVKGTNNLRSMYIRSITLGGQDEEIYEETDSLKMARAFRNAGRRLMDG